MVPGKKVFGSLNNYLQQHYKIPLSVSYLINCFKPIEIPNEMAILIEQIEQFRFESTD